MTKKIWRKARKKPVVIEFREIDDHFLEIETREGKLIANKEEPGPRRGGLEDRRQDTELQILNVLDLIHTNNTNDRAQSRSDFGILLKQAVCKIEHLVVVN